MGGDIGKISGGGTTKAKQKYYNKSAYYALNNFTPRISNEKIV